MNPVIRFLQNQSRSLSTPVVFGASVHRVFLDYEMCKFSKRSLVERLLGQDKSNLTVMIMSECRRPA